LSFNCALYIGGDFVCQRKYLILTGTRTIEKPNAMIVKPINSNNNLVKKSSCY